MVGLKRVVRRKGEARPVLLDRGFFWVEKRPSLPLGCPETSRCHGKRGSAGDN